VGLAVDGAGIAIVPNATANSVTEYAPGATGNAAPSATLSGASTLLSSPMAIALASPAVATGAASGISSTGATLNGTINPNGTNTTYSFQYGTTTRLGTTTPAVDAGSGTATVAAAATVGSLTAHSAYHFRIIATSDAGMRVGAEATFSTP
jgi:hypothetical protein